MKIIVFDTETTGIPSAQSQLEFQPYICQFAAVLCELDLEKKTIEEYKSINHLIKPPVAIEYEAVAIHGITNKVIADKPGFSAFAAEILEAFREADIAVAHNISFDKRVLECEFERLGKMGAFLPQQTFDTMESTVELCQLPGNKGRFKSPRLQELHEFLLGEKFEGAHDALADVRATLNCLKQLLKRGVFMPEEPMQEALF